MHTNPDVLWPTTTEDGTLLHLSRPATTIDKCFYAADTFDAAKGGEIRAGHAAINGTASLWYTVLAIELKDSSSNNMATELSAADLWPKPASSAEYNLWQWNNSACSMDKGPAGACVAALRRTPAAVPAVAAAAGPTPAQPSPDQVKWSLWSAAPVLSNGYRAPSCCPRPHPHGASG